MILWIVAAMLLLLLGILYLIQRVQISKQGRPDLVTSLGNAIGGVGIGICVVTAIWIILLIGLLRDARNVWADATSIYVSRDNLLLNWFVGNTLTPPATSTQGISGDPPGDHQVCNEKFTTPQDQEVAYAKYRELIKAYHGPGKIVQTYQTPGGQVPLEDDLVNQQKLSLAYYRYIYCTKAYFQDILNGVGIDQMDFLTQEAKTHLSQKTSSCPHGNTPDTEACVGGGHPPFCTRNECFTALNETISAQCLFYDDHVSSRIQPSGGKKGVLEAFQIPMITKPGGIQVVHPST